MNGGVRAMWMRMCPPACLWDGQRSAQPSKATCAGLDSCSEGYLRHVPGIVCGQDPSWMSESSSHTTFGSPEP